MGIVDAVLDNKEHARINPACSLANVFDWLINPVYVVDNNIIIERIYDLTENYSGNDRTVRSFCSIF